jgi:hypothetical protein
MNYTLAKTLKSYVENSLWLHCQNTMLGTLKALVATHVSWEVRAVCDSPRENPDGEIQNFGILWRCFRHVDVL